jgi:hypothetical protein
MRRAHSQTASCVLKIWPTPFNISLDSQNVFGDVENIKTAKVMIIHFGFSNHSMVCPSLFFVGKD